MRELQYEAGKEGSWSYKDMTIQVEDCLDNLFAIHEEKYQYMLLFGHSNGHDRISDGALTFSGVRKNFGGNQLFMKDSLMKIHCIWDLMTIHKN